MRKHRKGFSAIELFIVFVVVGIVASISIPKFSQAAEEARTAKLCKALEQVREQIQIFKSEHSGRLPGRGGADFIVSITAVTDAKANVYSRENKNSSEPFGPYLGEIPSNPFNDLNTVRINGHAAGSGTHGWRYDTYTGHFQPDDRNAGHYLF